MFEPLFLTDMLLAIAVIVAAMTVGASARPVGDRGLRRLRRVLYGTAFLVAVRLVVAFLLLTGGPVLAESRLAIQLPLAVLPITWALAVRSQASMAAHAAAVGVLLSGLWLFVPFDLAIELGASVAAIGLAVLLARWRATGSRVSRAPWLTVATLLAPAVVLGLAYQANLAARGGHH
uniref:hypothetical protein n=1 Tax=Nonomuraea lactucae TaxID=2249762 RepID=UPI0013B3E583